MQSTFTITYESKKKSISITPIGTKFEFEINEGEKNISLILDEIQMRHLNLLISTYIPKKLKNGNNKNRKRTLLRNAKN